MRALLTTLLAATLAVGGCAASTSSSDGDKTSVDVNDPSALKGATDVEGTLPVGSAVTIGYEKKPEYTQVPYLAVDVVPAADDTQPGDQTITVTGAFPGTPEVYVVDSSFALIPSTSTVVVNTDGTSVTTATVPRSTVGRTVIVHDTQWSSPMQFQISIGM
jgi:hypothetical protein